MDKKIMEKIRNIKGFQRDGHHERRVVKHGGSPEWKYITAEVHHSGL